MSAQNPQYPYRGENWEREIYPMPAFPTLAVTDVERSSRWYQDKLGFADVFTMRAPDNTVVLAHLRWCTYADVLLTRARTPVEPPVGRGITLNFAAESADDVAERARAAGVDIAEGPVNRPWNARDVTILDPDGYRLNFTGRVPLGTPGRHDSFEEIMARAGKQP